MPSAKGHKLRIFWNCLLPGATTALACLCLTLVNLALARDPPWQHAPGLADLGIKPAQAAALAGPDILLLPHGLHDIEVTGQARPGIFRQVRFVTGLLVVPISAEVLQHDLEQPHDATLGRGLHLHIEQLQTINQDQYYLETQDYPLPWLHWHLHMRWHRRTLSSGQWLTELQEGDIRASLSRTEIYPLDQQHCLLVFTLWSDLGSHSWIIRLLQQTQPELSRALPWLAVSTMLEAERQRYSPASTNSNAPMPSPFMEGSVRIHPWSALPGLAGTEPWVSVDQSFPGSPSSVLALLCQFSRYPEFLHALKNVHVMQEGAIQRSDWNLRITIGLLQLHRNYHITTERSAHEIDFQGRDDSGHSLQGRWDMLLGAHQNTQSRLSLQTGEDNGWITGYLRYTPYPEMAAPMLGALLILHRSHRWLLHASPKPSIPVLTKHTE
ncbi:MAG: hypothetical protein HKM02_08850 [Pseudomonadales bacterium]|nr:hypothetical protein [Pseudomonadales bacterium]